MQRIRFKPLATVQAYRRGVSLSDLRTFLNTNVHPTPAIYMFELGRYKDLSPILNTPPSLHPPETMIIKYGLTNNLKRRAQEHERTYRPFIAHPNSPGLVLRYHVTIEPSFLREAEKDLAEYFQLAKWHLNHTRYTELVAIPEEDLHNKVVKELQRIGLVYSNRMQDMHLQYLKQLVQEKDEQIRLYKKLSNF